MPFTIYALFDERVPEQVRYIGFSRNPEGRFRAHIKSSFSWQRRSYKANWIRSVIEAGARVLWRTLLVVDTAHEAALSEIELIATYAAEGHRLTNGTYGGEGVQGYGGHLSPEALAKRNATFRSAENRALRSAINVRRWSSTETREQHRQVMKEFWSSQEGIERKKQVGAKAALQMTGVVRSAESKNKMRLAKLGKPQMARTEEWKRKISEAQKGKPRRKLTEEEKAAHRDRFTPEVRAKMSASAKARKKADGNAN